MHARNIVYFDLETQKSADEVGGWDRIREMRMSVGVTYSTARQEYRIYSEQQVDDLLRTSLETLAWSSGELSSITGAAAAASISARTSLNLLSSSRMSRYRYNSSHSAPESVPFAKLSSLRPDISGKVFNAAASKQFTLACNGKNTTEGLANREFADIRYPPPSGAKLT